jgi:hypothetical protein
MDPELEPRIIGVTEFGDTWKQTLKGNIYLETRKEEKALEDRHIRPGFYLPLDWPEWHYNWIRWCWKSQDEKMVRNQLEKLTPEQLKELLNAQIT